MDERKRKRAEGLVFYWVAVVLLLSAFERTAGRMVRVEFGAGGVRVSGYIS
jgi:hypothetical protein